jgi:hypothetical protein
MLEYLTVVGNATEGEDANTVTLKTPNEQRDVLEVFESERVVVDHCTFLNGSDELASVRSSDLVLLCNNVIAYPNSVPERNDRRGSILGGKSDNSYIACHNNVYAQCDNRAPRFSAGNVFFQHNVIYNNRLKNTATVVANELDRATAFFKRNLVLAKNDLAGRESDDNLVYIYGGENNEHMQLVYVSENTIVRSPSDTPGVAGDVLFEAVDNRPIVDVKTGSDENLLTDDLSLVDKKKCGADWLMCLAKAQFRHHGNKPGDYLSKHLAHDRVFPREQRASCRQRVVLQHHFFVGVSLLKVLAYGQRLGAAKALEHHAVVGKWVVSPVFRNVVDACGYLGKGFSHEGRHLFVEVVGAFFGKLDDATANFLEKALDFLW